jgi:hypothetical protein
VFSIKILVGSSNWINRFKDNAGLHSGILHSTPDSGTDWLLDIRRQRMTGSSIANVNGIIIIIRATGKTSFVLDANKLD